MTVLDLLVVVVMYIYTMIVILHAKVKMDVVVEELEYMVELQQLMQKEILVFGMVIYMFIMMVI